MKRYHLLAPVIGMALTFAADVALCADDTARVPSTPAAQASAKLISRAERAINGFVAACVAHDSRALGGVTTNQVRVEYALDEPGTYLSMDASSLLAACAANNSGSHISNLWIFPTNDVNTVFVQYDAPSGESGSRGQLALVELNGDRISRMVNFAALPQSFVAGLVHGAAKTANADDGKTAFNNHCRTCHSVKQGDDRLGPSLYGVYGAEAGSIPGYRDSAQRFSGIIWDEPTLDRFIANPDQVISNNSMKPYTGIADAAVRQQIIDYLKSNRDLQSKH
jgi:cytochrome c